MFQTLKSKENLKCTLSACGNSGNEIILREYYNLKVNKSNEQI